MRSDILRGGHFPDYQLPDHMGTLRKLSELQGDDPLVLTLAPRPLLSEGAPAASGTRRVLPQVRRGLHTDRHDLNG
jgi:peroxiredoxin